MTHDYPQWRKDRCPHCAAGLPMSRTYDGDHFYNDGNEWYRCTAPTETEYIAELEAVIKTIGASSIVEFIAS